MNSILVLAVLTKCEQMRSKAQKSLLLGAKIPQCEADGSFKAVQTWEGYQWCVDEAGIELPGTRTGRGEAPPDCRKGLSNFTITLSCFVLSFFFVLSFLLCSVNVEYIGHPALKN